MLFTDALTRYHTILGNGPISTRLMYDYNIAANTAIEHEPGRQALRAIYEEDIGVAQAYQLPIIIGAATYRASKNHLPEHFRNPADVKRINVTAIAFMNAIRDTYKNPSAPIFVSAALGSMFDAYSAAKIPSISEAREYHLEQLTLFKESDVDVVRALTLPTLNEAIGIALSAQDCNINYTIGFILNKEGTLLDGTPLHTAISKVDAAVETKPLGFMITCTHASIIAKLGTTHAEYNRLIGIMPNGSALSPQELATQNKSIADSPEKFASDLVALKTRFKLKLLSGCCGTSKEHLEAIAQKSQNAG